MGMDTSTSKAQLLERIRAERAGWEALLGEIGEERMTQPGATGEWAFKDVAAHLNGWRERTVARLEAARRDESPPPPPWPAGFDEDSDEGVDRINAWIYERNRDRPLQDVLGEARAQFQQLEDAVGELPERDLTDPGRFPWLGGEPLGPAVLGGSFGHFHEEHEPTIRAWLDRISGETPRVPRASR